MNALINALEKQKPLFEKISRNIYLRAIVMVSLPACRQSYSQVSSSSLPLYQISLVLLGAMMW